MTMTMPAPTLLVDGLCFPECPRWHDDRLWFVDILGRQVLTVDLAGRLAVIGPVPARPVGLGFRPDGQLVVASQLDRRLSQLGAGGLQLVADLGEQEPEGAGLNDLVVDGVGRAYVRVVFGSGSLYLVHPDGAVRVAATGLDQPNGLVLTPDGTTLIVAETAGRRLTAFTVAPDGSLSHRRRFADLGARSPDGICLDAAGGVWVASPFTSEVVRVLDGGTITHDLAVPNCLPLACMLGGPRRQTLFLCVAQTTEADFQQGKSVGWIATVEVEAPGAGRP